MLSDDCPVVNRLSVDQRRFSQRSAGIPLNMGVIPDSKNRCFPDRSARRAAIENKQPRRSPLKTSAGVIAAIR